MILSVQKYRNLPYYPCIVQESCKIIPKKKEKAFFYTCVEEIRKNTHQVFGVSVFSFLFFSESRSSRYTMANPAKASPMASHS